MAVKSSFRHSFINFQQLASLILESMFRRKSYVIANGLYARVTDALSNYTEGSGMEELHIARVALKRLFTLWRMNRKHSGRECHGLVMIWKCVFREAGATRNQHVNSILFKKYSLYHKRSIPHESMNAPVLPVYLIMRELLEKEQNKLVSLASLSGYDECMKFCRNELEKLLSLLLTCDEEFWHPARKKAKHIRYIFDLFEETGKMPEAGFYDAVDRLQKQIGDWHDLVQFRSAFLPSELNVNKLKADITFVEQKVNASVAELFNSCSPEWLPDYLR